MLLLTGVDIYAFRSFTSSRASTSTALLLESIWCNTRGSLCVEIYAFSIGVGIFGLVTNSYR
jgi:hypothetical protein